MTMREYEIYTNYDLRKLSPIEVGGTIPFYYVVYTIHALKKVTLFLKECNKSFYVIGGCTKILFTDDIHYDAVIQFVNRDFAVDSNLILTAMSGIYLNYLSSYLSNLGYTGFEGLAGIPGLLGGAIHNNAGAYGDTISDSLISVTILDENSKIRKLSRKQCEFEYRNSVFFKNPNWIIVKSQFQLKKGEKDVILSKLHQNAKTRLLTQPLDKKTLGSTFKNIGNMSVGQMLESAGLKGLEYQGVKVSLKHANFLEFSGKNSSKAVLSLIDILINKVYNITKQKIFLEIIIVR